MADNLYQKIIATYKKYTAYVDSLFPPLQVMPSNILVCTRLNHEYFKGFNSSQNSLKVVLSQYKNIDQQISKIKSTTLWLIVNKKFTSQWCTAPITDFYVGNYFLSEKGQYIDEQASLLEFKNACLAYFTEYNKIVDSDNPMHIHNTSVLDNFTQGLLKTIESLINLQDTV